MDKLIAVLTALLGILAGLIGLSFLLSYPVMLLWNGCAVAAVAGLSQITWLQAWGLTALCSLLFKTTVAVNKK